MDIQKIVDSNKALGINTVFYYDNNGVLGCCEDGTIYLNRAYSNDFEKINKHEVLHFFEDSKQFKGIKKIIFDILGEKINSIRDQYYLKYNLLYSEEEIKNGVLDNEIAIDIMIHNGDFPIDVNDYIDNAYESIIDKKESVSLTNKGRKYLSLNVSNDIKNRYSESSKWDLLFANEYYKGKEKPSGKDRYSRIKTDSFLAWLQIGRYWLEDFKIDEKDNKELIRMLDSQIASCNSKGEFDKANELKNNYEESLAKLANRITWDLVRQYNDIRINLENSSKYSDSFKYLILNETLTKTYRYEKGNRIVDKRVMHKTILPHMLLNEYILDEIYSNIDNYNNFTDLYFDSLEKYHNEILNKDNVIFNRSSDGYWIRFESNEKGSDELEKNAYNLANLIANTPWCTRKNPKYWIEDGREFYVFVDNGKRPHVAVAVKDGVIEEVRGIKGEGDQEIEDEYRQLTIDFLKNNKNIVNAEKWLKKEERNYRLSRYVSKIKNNIFLDAELKDLVKDLNETEILTHGQINSHELELVDLISKDEIIRNKIFKVDPNAKRVIKIVEEIERNNRILNYYKKIENNTLTKEDLSQVYKDIRYEFYEYRHVENQNKLIDIINKTDNLLKTETAKRLNCRTDEVYIGDIRASEYFFKNDTKVFPYKYVLGTANFVHARDADVSKLKHVFGGLLLTFGENIDFSSLERVDKDIEAIDCKNVAFDSLEFVGGKLDAWKADCEFPKIKIIKGDARFEWYLRKDVNSLEYVGGNLTLGHVIKNMNKLKEVKGTIEFDRDMNEIEDLPSLEICEELYYCPDKIKEKFERDRTLGCFVKKAIKR